MKLILSAALVGVVIFGLFLLLKKDTYHLFYYPEPSNLTIGVFGLETDSLEECKNLAQVKRAADTDGKWDYECGKNCDIQGSMPYICEETLD